MLELPTLPLPISLNRYYRTFQGRVLISAQGRAYRETVVSALTGLHLTPLDGPLSIILRFYRPDNRRRDIDNLNKAAWDALRYAGVYHDDSQIEHADARMLSKGHDGLTGVVKIWVGSLLPDPGVAYFAARTAPPVSVPVEGAQSCKRPRRKKTP